MRAECCSNDHQPARHHTANIGYTQLRDSHLHSQKCVADINLRYLDVCIDERGTALLGSKEIYALGRWKVNR